MTEKEKASRPRMTSVNPKDIVIPKVRVTSTWSPEMLEMFKQSIEAMGIQQPLICVRSGKKLVLVDGLHRLEEAKLQNRKRVSVVVMEGDMKDVLLKNLMMNRLRGGTKASEMVKVITALRNEHGLTSEDVAKETGLRRDYVEKILETSRAAPEVLEALDREEIGVGHAWEIARVPSRDVQLRLLGQVFTYHLTIKDLHNIVDETLEIIKRREELEKQPRAPEPTSIPTARCHMCELEWPIRKVVGVNMCVSCYGIAQEAITKAKKEGRIPTHNTLAAEAAETPPHESITNKQAIFQQNLMSEPLEPIDYGAELPGKRAGSKAEKAEEGSETSEEEKQKKREESSS